MLDAGALTHPGPVASVMETRPAFEPRVAFAKSMAAPSDKDVRDFQLELQHIADPHPLVLFVNDPAKWRYLQFVVARRVHVVNGTFRRGHPALQRFERVVELD
jgi:hypothetical protein